MSKVPSSIDIVSLLRLYAFWNSFLPHCFLLFKLLCSEAYLGHSHILTSTFHSVQPCPLAREAMSGLLCSYHTKLSNYENTGMGKRFKQVLWEGVGSRADACMLVPAEQSLVCKIALHSGPCRNKAHRIIPALKRWDWEMILSSCPAAHSHHTIWHTLETGAINSS